MRRATSVSWIWPLSGNMYVSRVRGEEFSPKAFQSQLPEPLRGITKFHKRVRKSGVEWFKEHWNSPRIEASDHKDAIAKLHDLFSQLRPALLEIRSDDLTISAVLVSYCRPRQ
ncbi:hypothetical protein [Algihabitans albus]|uniref:hypothetical protein n=1 Tax=Algihabitans albus TaxID=2164067 RepID=UPI0013C350CB|nr:hypothetical protein [Algihabitans albus]